MSRPVGRYFESLVIEINALKKQENIVIDEQFKSRLRSEILAKITQMQTQSQEKLAFWEKFSKWRYHLAAIPMVLLVAVTLYGLSNLPLSFENKDIISEVPFPKKDESIHIAEVQSESEKNISRLQTFSGYTVMPSWYFLKHQQSQTSGEISSNNDSQKSQSKTVHEDSLPAITNSSPDSSSQTPLAAPSPASDSSISNDSPVPLSPNITSENVSSSDNSPSLSEPPLLDSNTNEAPENLVDSSSETTPDNSDSTAERSLNPDVQNDSKTDTFSESPTPSPSNFSFLPPISSSTDIGRYIYFKGSFQQSDKVFFEREIKAKIGSKELDFATVSRTGPGEAAMVIYFKDGSKSSYSYIFDELTAQWNLKTYSSFKLNK